MQVIEEENDLAILKKQKSLVKKGFNPNKEKDWEKVNFLAAYLVFLDHEVEAIEFLESFVYDYFHPGKQPDYWFYIGTSALVLALLYQKRGEQKYMEILKTISQYDILDPESTMKEEFEYQENTFKWHLENEKSQRELLRTVTLTFLGSIYFPLMKNCRNGEVVSSELASRFDSFLIEIKDIARNLFEKMK